MENKVVAKNTHNKKNVLKKTVQCGYKAFTTVENILLWTYELPQQGNDNYL